MSDAFTDTSANDPNEDQPWEEREIERINARLEVVSNWLIQGRGDPDALWLESKTLKAKREALLNA